ncbi:GAK system ATP-grasp enzyme [candidate division WOR-3 bacterium]|nr:GAK system ATP-grasp enzyme [candidate division WOR-3 bacterium]
MIKDQIAVIGLPGAWSTEILADEIQKITGFRKVIDMSQVHYDSISGSLSCEDLDLSHLDAIIVKKIGPQYNSDTLERLELLKYLHQKGTRIFSKPDSMMNCFDRLSGTLRLETGGIPIPATVITEDTKKALETVKIYKKAVFKPLFTSKARGMKVIFHDDIEIESNIRNFQNEGNPIMYIQKFVEIPQKDIGVVFLGGNFIGSYARVRTNNSWNTTTLSGGRYEKFEPSSEIIDMAKKAQDLFELDFTCIDIAVTPEGPLVFEASPFGGFKGLFQALNINAAKMYAQYVIDKIGG